jgi:heme oxygenase (mycobilin-producing)
MAIRVFIEREIDHGNENRLNQLLMDLRSKALRAKGYISGETLRLLDHLETFLVISTLATLEDWKNWEASEDRRCGMDELKPLLRAERTSVYTYSLV